MTQNNRLNSPLQEKILGHICTNKDAGYDTLASDKDITAHRVTVLRSLQALERKRYVIKQDIEPNLNRNIKTIFQPTEKGLWYAFGCLDVILDTAINKSADENDATRYTKFISKVVNRQARNDFMKNVGRALIDFELFDREGKLKVSSRQDLFNIGFMAALTGLAREKSPETSIYFGSQSMKELREILTPVELKEVRRCYLDAGKFIDYLLKATAHGLE